MQDMSVIRDWQFAMMQRNLQTLESIVAAASPDHLTDYRDGSDGWTILEILCHLRDFEAVYLERVQLMVSQDNPALPFPDPDALVAEKRYHEEKASDALAELKRLRTTFLEKLQSLQEGDWECTGQHPTRGVFTPHDQLFLTTFHDNLHLEQITRILAEKQS